jgi:diadenosine tetraphosphate (Ap4A) HIT family hydrolase
LAAPPGRARVTGAALPDCLPCRNTAAPELPVRERIVQTQHWRVAHAFNTALPGWLVAVPTVHITAIAELSPAAAAELGPLLRDLSRALHAVVGCVKTYVIQLAEAEGFSHVHFHVVPRPADQPEELRGPRIFGMLGVPPEQCVGEAEMDRLGSAIRAQLA